MLGICVNFTKFFKSDNSVLQLPDGLHILGQGTEEFGEEAMAISNEDGVRVHFDVDDHGRLVVLDGLLVIPLLHVVVAKGRVQLGDGGVELPSPEVVLLGHDIEQVHRILGVVAV